MADFITVPVDHDPFKDPAPVADGGYSLTPVDFDPFAGSQPQPKGTALTRGFVSGIAQQTPENIADALEGASLLSGAPEFGAWGDKLRSFASTPEGYEPQTRSLGDISGVSSGLTYAGERLGEGLASTVPSLATGLAGAAAGSTLGPVGATVGGIAGAGATSLAQSYGELYRALKDEGVSKEESARIAAYGALPIAGLDVVPVARWVDRLAGAPRQEAVRGLAKRVAQELGKGAAIEAGTEGAQAALQEGIVATAAGKPALTWDRAQQVLENAIAGGLTGGAIGGVTGLAPDRAAPPPAADTKQATPPAAQSPLLALPSPAIPMPDQSGEKPPLQLQPLPLPGFGERLALPPASTTYGDGFTARDPRPGEGYTPPPIGITGPAAPKLIEGKGTPMLPGPDGTYGDGFFTKPVKGDPFAAPAPDGLASMINAAAAKAGIDPALFTRQVAAESNFKPGAVSPKGAQGLAQLMPPTAAYLARKHGIDPTTPQGNLEGGALYFAEQMRRFGGDVRLALAAYNAGPGRVTKMLKAGKDFSTLPRETQDYVDKIMAGGDVAVPGGGQQFRTDVSWMPPGEPMPPPPPASLPPPPPPAPLPVPFPDAPGQFPPASPPTDPLSIVKALQPAPAPAREPVQPPATTAAPEPPRSRAPAAPSPAAPSPTIFTPSEAEDRPLIPPSTPAPPIAGAPKPKAAAAQPGTQAVVSPPAASPAPAAAAAREGEPVDFGRFKEQEAAAIVAGGRERGEPVLDLRRQPTGWVEVRPTGIQGVDTGDVVLLHPTKLEARRFSGPRAAVYAQAYAIDNPVEPEASKPAELVVKPLFEKPATADAQIPVTSEGVGSGKQPSDTNLFGESVDLEKQKIDDEARRILDDTRADVLSNDPSLSEEDATDEVLKLLDWRRGTEDEGSRLDRVIGRAFDMLSEKERAATAEEERRAKAYEAAKESAPKPAAPETSVADDASALGGAGLQVRQTTTKGGKTAWEVVGNTRDHKDLIKSLGGRWYGPKKAWTFYKGDPTASLAGELRKSAPTPAEPPAASSETSETSDGPAKPAKPAKVEGEQGGNAETPAPSQEAKPEKPKDAREKFRRDLTAIGAAGSDGTFYKVIQTSNGGFAVEQVKKGIRTTLGAGGPIEVWTRQYAIERATEEEFGEAAAPAPQPPVSEPAPAARQEPAEETATQEPQKQPEGYGAGNKIFTADAAERARQRLRAKMGRLNSGLDPELLIDGMMLAGYHIEAGARTFAAYSAKMVADLGEEVRPFLRSFYNAVRDYPGFDNTGMTPAAEIEAAADQPSQQPQPDRDTIEAPQPGEPEDVRRPDPEPVEADDRGSDEAARPADAREPTGDGKPEPGARPQRATGARGGARGGRRKKDAAAAEPGGGPERASGGVGPSDQLGVGDGDSAGVRVPGRERAGASDYSAPAGSLKREGSWKTTAERNLDIIELVNRLDAEKRLATADEQALLAKWTGWGASEIRNKLFSQVRRNQQGEQEWADYGWTDPEWKPLAERARKLLTGKALESAMQSTQYAHYTSEAVVRSIWKAMQRFGFAGGKLLEPGMGNGLFAIAAPAEVMERSKYVGIELDQFTAKVASFLLPHQQVLAVDYTRQKLPDAFFDAAIGNPPFAKVVVSDDPAYRKHRFSLHNYFFAKTIDKVRPGGVLAFVTSRYTMDSLKDDARKFMAERADLLGAIRLPQTAFMQNAGTEVVTDVLFLQRRTPGAAAGGESWLGHESVKIGDKDQLINEYFAGHPEMVLGQHALTGSMYRKDEYTVEPRKGQDIEEAFSKAIEALPENVYKTAGQQAVRELNRVAERFDFDPKAKKEGAVYVADDGALMVVDQGRGRALDNDGKPLSEADKVWLRGYVDLRDKVKQAQADQLHDGDWEKSLKALNATYDAFVKKHGPINDFSTYERKSTDEDGNEVTNTYRRYKNEARWELDVENTLVQALERVDEDGKISKGPFLQRRTLKRPDKPKIETTQDALFVSLDQVGRFDLAHIAALAGEEPSKIVEELGDLIYEAPAGGWQMADEYLSGDVRSKLDEARVAASGDQRFQRNVKALERVQPLPIAHHRIDVQLGAGWVPDDVIDDFASEKIGILRDGGGVSYSVDAGKWTVPGGELRRERGIGNWSTKDRSAAEILESVLNNRELKIVRSERVDGSTKTWTDKDATAKVNDIAAKMRDAWSSWVWSDSGRVTRLVDLYNERFNNMVPREFNGEHLTLPGMSTVKKLFPHQKRAVWRVIQTGNTYLAHAVGAGKTLEMIASAMEQKRLGLVKKPMFVVPNHMLNQFSREFLEAYPAANIMVASERAFHTGNRRRFIAQASLNDPDAIIITHSSFGKLPTSREAREQVIGPMIAELESAINALDSQTDRVARRKLEQQAENLRRRMEGKMAGEGKDQNLTFEDMGVDFVYVDEAHEFRKLDFMTDMGNTKGIDPQGSARALDLYIKMKWLERQRPGRSAVLASGTPITNTIAELFSVMRYLDEGSLQRDGIAQFDAWAKMFGQTKAEFEQNAAGQYEFVSRFRRFTNIPELMKRVREFMDVLTMDQLGSLVDRPTIVGGRPENVVTDPSSDLKAYMKGELAQRIKDARDWKPSKEEPFNPDPLIAIISDARLATIDMRFVDPKTPNDPNSKLNQMIDRIIEQHDANAGEAFVNPVTGKPDPIKGATQIVFSAVGFGEQAAQSRGFDLRGWVMGRFRKAGIPASQVAWMSDYDTHAKKEAMFKEMRSGKKRILIGSPKNMGTGVNVQSRLKVLHYLSPPWYPADVEQPHGRIVRQGNQNKEVNLFWYATKGTYDSTQWGMVASKGRFIEQALRGDDSIRSIDDVSEVSQYEMASALAAGDDRAIKVAGLQADIERLSRLRAAHGQEQQDLRSQKWWKEGAIKGYEGQIEILESAQKVIGANVWKVDPAAEVGGEKYGEPGKIGAAILAAAQKEIADWEPRNTKSTVSIVIGRWDFEGKKLPITAELRRDWIGDDDKKRWFTAADIKLQIGDLSEEIESDITADTAHSPQRAATTSTRISTAIREVSDRLRKQRDGLKAAQRELREIESRLGAPFDREGDLVEKTEELRRLQQEMAAPADADLSWMPDAIEIERWEDEGGAPTRERPVSASVFGRSAAPSANEQRAADRIIEIVKQIAPAADVRVVRKLLLDVGAGQQEAGGSYEPLKRLVTVALNFGDPEQTAGHEAIHALRDMGVFTAEEDALLAKTAREKWIDQYDVRKHYPGASEEMLIEEGIAEAFADWRANPKAVQPPVARLFARLRALFLRIANALRGMGFRTVEDIFGAAASGEVGARSRKPSKGGPVMAAAAWHGSRGDFDRFSSDKIGTGEGAQAYGYGLYFAGRKEVAEYYRKTLSGSDNYGAAEFSALTHEENSAIPSWLGLEIVKRGMPAVKEHIEIFENRRVEAEKDAKNSAQPWNDKYRASMAAKMVARLQKIADSGSTDHRPPGRLYQVDLKPAEDEYLLWDEPLSKQSEKVKAALATFVDAGEKRRRAAWKAPSWSLNPGDDPNASYDDTIRGSTEYGSLAADMGGQKAASEALLAAGVRGIKYLDGASRNAQKWSILSPEENTTGKWRVSQFGGARARTFESEAAARAFMEKENEGAYNYVIFDDADIEIVAKASLFQHIRAAAPAMAQPAQQAGTAEQRAAVEAIIGKPDSKPWLQRARETIREYTDRGALELKQGFLDQFAAIEALEKGQSGGKLKDATESAYKATRMTRNLQSVMAHILRHGPIDVHDDPKTGGRWFRPRQGWKGGGFEDIFKPLAEKGLLDLWRGWAAAVRANRLMQEGRERLMTQDQIDALLPLGDQYPEFREAHRKWRAFNKAALDMAEGAGIINAEQRDAWENDDYVPFYRILDEQDKGAFGRGKEGISGQRSGIVRLEGGTEQLNDPIENMVRNLTGLIDRSFKNLAMQKVTALAVDAGAMEKKTASTARQYGDDVPAVSVMIDGKPVYYHVHDPLLLRAVTSISPQQLGGVMALFRMAKRLLTESVTLDPAFMVANGIRDTLSAWVTTGQKGFRPGIDSMSGFVKALRADPSRLAIMAAGAGTGGYYGTAPEDARKFIERHVRRFGKESILDTPRKLWEAWHAIGAASESANRIAIYEAAKKAGATDAEAAYQALDLIDFGMRGDFAAMRALIDMVPFLNARIQGLYRLGRGIAENPKQFLLRGSIIAAATLALLAANWDNPEYEDLEDWDKDTYWHIWVGGQHFRLPKPFEVGALFATIPERMFRALLGRDDTKKSADAALRMVTDTFAINPTPQLVAPLVEQFANKDMFTGRPIEGVGMERLPPGMRARPDTSEVAQEVGDALGVSPLRIQHAVGGYFGTLGLHLLAAADQVAEWAGGYPVEPTLRIDEIPVLQRFMRDDPARSTRFVTEFYNMRRESAQAMAGFRELQARGQVDEAREFLADKRDKLAMYKGFEKAADALAQMNKASIMIRRSSDMTADQKRERLDAITRQRNEISKAMVERAAATAKMIQQLSANDAARRSLIEAHGQ